MEIYGVTKEARQAIKEKPFHCQQCHGIWFHSRTCLHFDPKSIRKIKMMEASIDAQIEES